MNMYTHVVTCSRIQYRETEFNSYTQIHVDGLWEQVMVLVSNLFLLYGVITVIVWTYILVSVCLGILTSELFDS